MIVYQKFNLIFVVCIINNDDISCVISFLICDMLFNKYCIMYAYMTIVQHTLQSGWVWE